MPDLKRRTGRDEIESCLRTRYCLLSMCARWFFSWKVILSRTHHPLLAVRIRRDEVLALQREFLRRANTLCRGLAGFDHAAAVQRDTTRQIPDPSLGRRYPSNQIGLCSRQETRGDELVRGCQARKVKVSN